MCVVYNKLVWVTQSRIEKRRRIGGSVPKEHCSKDALRAFSRVYATGATGSPLDIACIAAKGVLGNRAFLYTGLSNTQEMQGNGAGAVVSSGPVPLSRTGA